MAWNGGARPDPVERGLRRPRDCTSTGRRQRRERRLSPACSPASPSPTGPTWSSPSALVLGWLLWRRRDAPGGRRAHRHRRRPGPDVGAPRHRRAASRRGRAWSSTRSSTSAPGASCPARRRGAASTARCRRSPRQIPPWWRLPHLARIAGAVPVVLRDARRHRRARRRVAVWQRRAAGATAGPTVLLVVALVSVGILPAGAAAAGLDPPHVGDVRVVAVRRRRRHRGRPARGGRTRRRAERRWPSAPPSPSC